MDTELRVKQSGIYGPLPAMFFGVNAPDGDADPFKKAPVGTLYFHKDNTNNLLQIYAKRKHAALDSDWGPVGGLGVISETVSYSQFTDGGSTSGTYVMKQGIPAGAVVLRTLLREIVGFTGNVSATITVGDGSDVDRYNTGTPSVYTTDDTVDAGSPSGTTYHDAAKSVTLTVTSASDFTAVAAGRVTVTIFYYL